MLERVFSLRSQSLGAFYDNKIVLVVAQNVLTV